MLKVLSVIGTRPEAIKMAPLAITLRDDHRFQSMLCVTAQHRQMLDQVLEVFNLKPDYDLDIMQAGQDLTDITAKIIIGMRDIFSQFKPDIVLVHGDTTTTFATSLSACYHQVQIAHVEAGLRTGNLLSPFPEEANRKLTGALAALHFAPTQSSQSNLIAEGVSANAIEVTGNTVIDALFKALALIDQDTALKTKLETQFNFLKPARKLIMVTGHRRESFGGGFERICDAVCQLAQQYPEIDIVYPVHLNPNVQVPVRKYLSKFKNIFLIEPLDYLPFIYLMKRSYLILTDSGGVQEEAPSLGIPVLVMRDTTERPEAVQSGTVKLVGTDTNLIVSNARELIENLDAYKEMNVSQNPYGDGCAVERIISHLIKYGEKINVI